MKKQQDKFPFMGVRDAAKRIGVSGGRIRQLLAAEELDGEKLGDQHGGNPWNIAVSEVERYRKKRNARLKKRNALR